jgi:flagellin
MGLRINTNLSALTALRTLSINDQNQARSLERLSTGLRINRGADDPSGLIISEQLRGQLATLKQAIENSQNASNLLSIADAALQEVSNLLVRIQDSITFALNTGGASPAQIAAEQDAVDQAIAAIDRIAATTRYAERELINGSVGIQLVGNRPTYLHNLRVKSVSFAPGELERTFTLEISRDPQRAQIRVVSAYTVGSTILRITGPRGTDEINIASGSRAAAIADAINSVAGFTGVFASGVATGSSQPLDLFSEEFGTSQLIKIEIVQGRISGYNTAGSVQILADDGNLTTTGVTQTPLDPGDLVADWGLDGQVSFLGQLFTGEGRQFNILTRVASVEFAIAPSSNTNQINLQGTTQSFEIANTGLTFQLNELPRPTDQLMVGIEGVNTNILGLQEFRDRISEAIRGVSAGAPSSEWVLTGGFLSTVKTGAGNDLTQNPQNAQAIVRAAVSQVARVRGFLGAVQADTIQPNIASLRVTVENVTASLSSIRDLDFAEEVVNLTRTQILFQSGIASLANTLPIPRAVIGLLGM